MSRLINSYAIALLEFGKGHGLDEFYRQALQLVVKNEPVNPDDIPGPLGGYLQRVPTEDILPVLQKFLDLARSSMEVVPVRVFSAVPLTREQLVRLELKLVKMFHKQLELTTTVDPSLLGGLRVIVGNVVLDDTLKRKLLDMKSRVYKGVYLRYDTQSH